MPGPFDFTGQNIENTYQRVLQTDGTLIYDGTGSLFAITSQPSGPNQSIQFNDNGVRSGSSNFTFNKTTNVATLTGSLTATAGFTGSLLGVALTAVTASFVAKAQTVTVSPSSSAAVVAAEGNHKFYPLFGSVRNDGNFTTVNAYVNSGSFQYIMGTNTLTVTSSYANQALSSSFAVSSSFATTASFTPNAIVGAVASTNTITFTKGNGTTNQITIPASPAGSTTEIQYNNAGVLAGTGHILTFDGTTVTANPISATGYFIPANALGSLTTYGADYTISNSGVYRFTSMDPNGGFYIIFPDPTLLADGQTIIIINADTIYAGYYNQTYAIQDPSGTAITIIGTSTADTFVNMEGIWIRTSRRP